MNFATTSADDFKTMKNGIDERITFMKHLDSGFYNITKARNIVAELKSTDCQAAGYPAPAIKKARDWFVNASTQELIDELKKQTGLKEVRYDLSTGTPKAFHGTYVHELLIDHFLIWLDPKYGVKVSIILREIHEKAMQASIKEKDDKIDQLEKKIDMILNGTQRIEEQNKHISLQNELTHAQNKKLQFCADVGRLETKKAIRIVESMSSRIHMNSTVAIDITNRVDYGRILFARVDKNKSMIELIPLVGNQKELSLYAAQLDGFDVLREFKTLDRNADYIKYSPFLTVSCGGPHPPTTVPNVTTDIVP